MGLRDVLLGRKKLAAPARERLFALTTAAVTLDTELGLKHGRRRPASSSSRSPPASSSARRTTSQQLLDAVATGSGSKLERREDSFGYTWIIVRDPDLEDQVARRFTRSRRGWRSRDSGRSYSPRSSSSTAAKNPVYWIYGYKRGAFWPFVPTGEEQKRDNAEELELKAKLEKELPVEQDLTPLVRRLRRTPLGHVPTGDVLGSDPFWEVVTAQTGWPHKGKVRQK